MKKLRAIFFDIDDTLYPTTEFARQARENAVDAMIEAGLRLPRADALRELFELIEEFSSNYEHHYDKMLVRIPRSAYEPINPIVIIAAAVVAYHETKFRTLRAYEDAVEVLKLLARTDLVRGVITTGIAVKQAEKLLRLRVYRYLTPTALFISDQIGISKPNVKLYQRACQDVGVPPGEALMVGDHPAGDIDPAKKLGMWACRVRRGGKYQHADGARDPDFEIHNFWELLEILGREFGIDVGPREPAGVP
ncbi:MAG: TIGR02253 family HAD-type hydrolase [Planctomycetes bacterium]|nr:TIGR02253 family HAD-type hydrolase [Planctomycetota bacterium]